MNEPQIIANPELHLGIDPGIRGMGEALTEFECVGAERALYRGAPLG